MQTPRILTVAACAAALSLSFACQKGASDKKDNEADPQGAAAAPQGAAAAKPATPANPHGGSKDIAPPMDVAAPPATATKTTSGISYVVLAEGKDKSPGRNDTADVNYTVWRPTGQTLFSTSRRGRPQSMPLPMIPDGWSEMLQAMKTGEKRLVWMPGALAMRGGGAQSKENFVFEMELVSFETAPPVPADVAAPPADAVKTKSGLAYKVLEKGTGKDRPRAWDTITVHYTGWSSDGRMFEDSTQRKQPRTITPYQESKGWAEAVQYLVDGQKTRIWMPAELLPKRPDMPETAAVYDVELLKHEKMSDPPPVPKDVAAPPADAKKTELGVFYKVIKKGAGKDHPTADHRVKVHYTGWTTDGAMFDSSRVRGQPASFSLRQVIPGWTDGLQTMVAGQTTRLWIPEEHAYRGQPGKPAGMLVFDVELLEILEAAPPRQPPGHPQIMPPHGQMKGGQKPAGKAGQAAPQPK